MCPHPALSPKIEENRKWEFTKARHTYPNTHTESALCVYWEKLVCITLCMYTQFQIIMEFYTEFCKLVVKCKMQM